jgi:hypothetical protein
MPKALNCPNCGAPLEVKDDAIATKCQYCGTPIQLTQEIRRVRQEEVKPPPPPPPQIVVQQSTIDLSDLVAPTITVRRSSGCFGCFTGLFFTALALGFTVVVLFASGAIPSAVIESVLTQLPPDVANAARSAIDAGSSAVGITPSTRVFGGEGTGLGKFSDARHLAVSPDGKVYVTDFNTKRVQRFLPDGTFDVMFEIDHGINDYGPSAIAADRNYVYVIMEGDLLQYSAESGEQIRQFAGSGDFEDVTIASNGNVITVTNDSVQGGDRIIIYSNEGRKLSEFKDNVAGVIDETTIFDHYVAADGAGNVYVYVGFEYFVFKFSSEGRYVDRFGGEGDAPENLRSPNSIGVDNSGRVYVADIFGIKVYESDGTFVRTMNVGSGAKWDVGFNLNDEMYVLTGNDVYRVSVK